MLPLEQSEWLVVWYSLGIQGWFYFLVKFSVSLLLVSRPQKIEDEEHDGLHFRP